jgi:hypothetical protein
LSATGLFVTGMERGQGKSLGILSNQTSNIENSSASVLSQLITAVLNDIRENMNPLLFGWFS